MLYIASKHFSTQKGSLVDRDANGGIAGEDVCISDKTGRQVDFQRIDNHE